MKTQISEISAEELMERIRYDDTRLFTEIVRRYQNYAYSLAYRVLKNSGDAEEIVQESFIRVWKSRGKYRREIKFTTWFYKIVVNLCYDKIRYRRGKSAIINESIVPEEVSGSSDDPGLVLDGKELLSMITRFAEELSEKQRMVFTLRDLQNLSVTEVAEVLGISEESVKTNLVYARRTLKTKINKEYGRGLL